MPKLLRKKLAWTTILIYWPVLFTLTHIPLPRIVHEAHLSDRSLHFMMYFILVVLLWSVVKPYTKVKWYKATVWIILAVVAWYGAVDEWLQHWVEGRTPDVWDFLSDLAGAGAGLLLLSIVPFRPAILFTTALAIFITTGCSKTELIEHWPVIRFSFYFLAYGFFTLLWLFCLCRGCLYRAKHKPGTKASSHPRSGGLEWLTLGATLPVLMLVLIKLGTFILGRRFVTRDIWTSALGIACALGVFLVVRKIITTTPLQNIRQEKT